MSLSESGQLVLDGLKPHTKHEQPAVKAARLRRKLGGGPALLQPLPPRPKYMRREKYETLCYLITALEIEAVQGLKQYRNTRWLPKLLKLDELAAQGTPT